MPLAGGPADGQRGGDMVAATASLIARLQAECTDAEAQERAVRLAVEAKVREAEQARAFAWRRLNALGDMARIAALEPDRGLFFDRDGRHLRVDEVMR